MLSLKCRHSFSTLKSVRLLWSDKYSALSHSQLKKFRRYQLIQSNHSDKSRVNILGIETSCDDTGTAVVNDLGQVLGEGYYSQVKASIKFGGVVPIIARKYHEDCIEKAVNDALDQSNLTPDQLTAIAATVKPGTTTSLTVGTEFGKSLALKYGLPFIPIHHMEAHALTVRMENEVEFPFLVLLVSGGHCLLALAHDLDQWSIIGQTGDAAPGCILDRLARRMKLRNIPGMDDKSGGKAIEVMALKGDQLKYDFPTAMSKISDANFSFSGYESFTMKLITQLEEENGIEGGRVLEQVSDVCASLELAVVKHLVRRTHRAITFLRETERIPEDKRTLVISGGVSANLFLREAFEKLCRKEGYRLLVPPPKLCTDNGIMVAWNGIERWRARKGVLFDADEIKAVTVEHKSPLGPDISAEHLRLNLSIPKWVDIRRRNTRTPSPDTASPDTASPHTASPHTPMD